MGTKGPGEQLQEAQRPGSPGTEWWDHQAQTHKAELQDVPQ